MGWEKENLDLILVPSGLLINFGYHLYHLYRCLKHTDTTLIGYENHIKRKWIKRMLQVDLKDRGPAISVISSSISAATSIASISLILSSLIGAWVGSTTQNIFKSAFIYGNTSSTLISIKYISLLFCFLLAFTCFVESARYFVQVNFFITMPTSEIHMKYVRKAMIRGNTFWSIGLRALYIAITLLLWIFGPIPMFVSSVILVVTMHYLDQNSNPLHKFPPNKHNLLKISQEIVLAGATGHHGRLNENGSTENQIHNIDQPAILEGQNQSC